MANIINWDENPLAQELEKERAVSAQLIKQRDEAREEVERLKAELAQAISERTPHDYGILKDQRDSYRDRLCASMKETQEALAEVKRLEIINEEVLEANYTMGTTCAEPSRLEIAAMIYAAFAGAQCMKDKVNPTVYVAFKCADELIAAAKEVAK
jgi:ribosomal protein L16 Arg81 hydroxylase